MDAKFEKTLYEGPLCTYGDGPGGWVKYRALNNGLEEHWERATMKLSKSRYLKGLQCMKAAWMLQNRPEESDAGQMDEGALSYGHKIGELARGYFGDYVEVPFDPHDLDGMELRTTELLEQGTPVICEAMFKAHDCMCLVDILRMDEDGSAHVIEVKAAKRVKDINVHDIAYQVWVMREWGLPVKSASLMHVWNAPAPSELEGVDPKQPGLFALVDVTEDVMQMQRAVAHNVERMRRWASLSKEPGVYTGAQCNRPYPCTFKAWCDKRMEECGRAAAVRG